MVIINLKNLRKLCKISQLQLATSLGVERSTVAKWETGKSFPRTEELPKIAKIFGCTIDDLFEKGEDEENDT